VLSAVVAAAAIGISSRAYAQADVSGGYVSSHVIIKVRPGVEPAFRGGQWTLASTHPNAPSLIGDAAGDVLARWKTEAISALHARLPADPRLIELRGIDRYYRVHVPEGTDAPAFVAALAELDTIAHAELDGIGGVAEIPNDSFFDFQYGMHNIGQTISGQSGFADADINAPQAWEITTGTSDLVLAVLDAGVSSHVDLTGRLVPGWAFDGGSPADTCGSHGTHVAGIAAANGDNGLGVAGVDWNVKVQSYRVLAGCQGFESTVAEGILEAVAQNVDVINMSLQYYTGSQALRDAVLTASAADIPLICATGNNQSSVAYPARWPETIAIAATDNRDEVAPFSNAGSQTDIAAPGDNVYSLTGTSSYGYKDGTSMATPHVSGLVCLMLALDPDLTTEEIRDILIDTAVDVEDPGFDDDTGWGRLDAEAALLEVLDGVAVPGDANGDGQISVLDIMAVIFAWGECGAPCPEDLDNNGMVDVLDLAEVILNWS
jgi:subtilisin family serine protease